MSGLYLATITVRVPLRAVPTKIGGKDYNADEVAAWHAGCAMSYFTGAGVVREMQEAGDEAVLGLSGEVTRLERLSESEHVEPDFEKVRKT